ncbi:MAG: peptidylprolyl isomerase [candidate division Zixibacteria bacterium]|nr:peptidylprolyl isomerase [candidate division Zixibacteria bacterium]
MKIFLPALICLSMFLFFLTSCGNQQAQGGDTVQVRYVGHLENGKVFDSSQTDSPLIFEIGTGQVIPGFDKAVTGMITGETKTVTIPPEDAYGLHQPDLTHKVTRSEFPAEVTPKIGLKLKMGQPDGSSVPIKIIDIYNDTIVLDANHELAGKTLIFDLELLKILNK